MKIVPCGASKLRLPFPSIGGGGGGGSGWAEAVKVTNLLGGAPSRAASDFLFFL